MNSIFARSLCLLLILALSFQTLGQSLSERIKDYKDRQRQQFNQPTPDSKIPPVSMRSRLIIRLVDLRDITAQEAFNWWSATTNIPLIIDWEAMSLDGINPETRITLVLRDVPANQVLSLLMNQVSPHTPLITESTPWYMRIMTKRQANSQTEVRVYDVGDLVMRIRDFNNAPEFDLDQALSNTSAGSSGGSGGSSSSGSIFGDDDSDTDDDQNLSTEERATMLIQLIEQTIEPEIWGVEGSIRFYQNRLIIKAPRYVHNQIGIPVATPSDGKSLYPDIPTVSSRSGNTTRVTPRGSVGPIYDESSGVASINPNSLEKVSGTGESNR